MLDEYLENEGKLIDERAASFSQPPVEPPVYELPTHSSSYVRTLDSVLRQSCSTPTSALISGFVPPSKRPKLPPKESRKLTKADRKQKAQKLNKPRPDPAADPGPAKPGPPLQPPEPPGPATEAPRQKKHPLKVRAAGDSPMAPPRKKRLKPTAWSRTLRPEDLAPLESDSELGEEAVRGVRPVAGRPLMTRALLKQRELEDAVVWGGHPRTCITPERATIALTSLFTLSVGP